MNTSTIQVIAVPTDFSSKSENAVKMAIEIANRHQAKVIIFHVIYHYFVTDRTGRQLLGKNVVKDLTNKAENALKKKITKEKKQNPALSIEAKILSGNLLAATNQLIEDESADLLVMGTSGKQKLKQTVLGSHSYESLQNINCDLLLMPEKHKKYCFENIVFPVRTEEDLIKKTELGVSIAHKNDAKIKLLGICTIHNYEKIKTAFSSIRKKLHHHHVDHEPTFIFSHNKAQDISQFSDDSNSDLIILNNKDENRWKSLFSGNFLKRMINTTEIPLFFIKNKGKKTQNKINNYDINLPFTG